MSEDQYYTGRGEGRPISYTLALGEGTVVSRKPMGEGYIFDVMGT